MKLFSINQQNERVVNIFSLLGSQRITLTVSGLISRYLSLRSFSKTFTISKNYFITNIERIKGQVKESEE